MNRQPDCAVDTSVDTSSDESVNLLKRDIGRRIKQAREAAKLTQDGLAALASARSKSGLQDNEAGKSMPGGQILGALAKVGINTNWVLTGSGDMFVGAYETGTVSASAVNEPMAQYSTSQIDSALLQQVIDFFMRWMAENSNNVRINRSRWGAVIAVLYRLSAQAGKVDEPELVHVLKLAA